MYTFNFIYVLQQNSTKKPISTFQVHLFPRQVFPVFLEYLDWHSALFPVILYQIHHMLGKYCHEHQSQHDIPTENITIRY